MNPIPIPARYNYIGIFLTFDCNLRCSYCINNFERNLTKRFPLDGKAWVAALNRIQSRPDLPVTLQGGEPTMHPDCIFIINNLKPDLHIDVLTNLQFDIPAFIKRVDPQRIKRDAPYASIRVSYHPEQMKLPDTIERTLALQRAGFSVGIWSVLHPRYEEHIRQAQKECLSLGIDFRFKDFLGEYNGKLYGSYKYAGACSHKPLKQVSCRTSELLVDPAGQVYRCHHDVYERSHPVGSLLDEGFLIADRFSPCSYFGCCNPCDVKIKTNRFQTFGHTSVDIRFEDQAEQLDERRKLDE
ncbi:MAG TPA: radical SAM protein [Candidatus Omnitrophota bacterium]|nr:radical SAM protein [Candidatus Omnitrophota bacterium]HRZ15811.1 radical SAM protein [Candidatus Omnitrophota bacterium]